MPPDRARAALMAAAADDMAPRAELTMDTLDATG